jgi:gliding motility-associated-like protein
LTYSVGVTVGSGTVTCNNVLAVVTNTGLNIWNVGNIPAGNNVIITVTDINGCSNSLPPITAPNCACPVILPPVSGGNKSYCAGGIIPALTATVLAGETIDWYDSGGNLLSRGSLSFTPTGAGTYWALARNTTSSCVSSTKTAIVLTMNPLPTATLTSSDADNIFCSGTSVTFTATGGTSYNFFVSGLSIQNGVAATYTTTTLTNGQAVNVIVTNANGCSATSAGITNTVNITPVPTLTSSDADNSFCLGTNVTFTASGGTNYNFRVAGASVQNGSLTTYTTNSLTNGQVVDVIVSNTNGCTATSTGITNSVFDSTTAIAGTGGNNCGPKFHLNGSVPVVGIGTWSQISGPGIATFSNLNTANSFVTIPASAYGSYTFAWTVANGTCSTSATVTVVFIQQPPANAGSGGDVCGESFTMNAPVTTGLGTWAKIIGPGIAVFTPDNHHPDAKVTVDQFGAYSFEWTLVNSTCTSTDTINVVFHDKPALNAGRDTAVCKGSSVQLQAKGTGAVAWVPAALVSNPNIINPIATPDTTTTFTVNLTDQFGCKNSDDIVVEVRDTTTANAGPDQVLGYIFTTTMDAVLAHSYENGVWSIISGTGDFVDSTNAKTTVKKLSPGKNKFLWTVTNGYCPVSHDTAMISVIEFIIPTLITPNGDGRNDYFVLSGLATLGRTELIIFDRRGAQVYKNLNYDNSWNGLDYNKNPLPDDTYFYVIKSANGKSISGYIVIRR